MLFFQRHTETPEAGFTLMELMIVITIVALMAGIGIGLFDSGEDKGLQAANIILAASASARSQSRLEKEPVVLNLSEHVVRITAQGKQQDRQLPARVSLVSVETSRDRTNEGKLVFQPRGITRAAVVSVRYENSVYSVYIPSIGPGKVFGEARTLDQVLKEQ